jgi:hypothetical protein
MIFEPMDRSDLDAELVELTDRLDALAASGHGDRMLEVFMPMRDLLENSTGEENRAWLDDRLRKMARRSGMSISDYLEPAPCPHLDLPN